jgi:hypothetical protein
MPKRQRKERKKVGEEKKHRPKENKYYCVSLIFSANSAAFLHALCGASVLILQARAFSR